MAAASTPGIEPAVITASASVVIAMVAFMGTQFAQRRNERRQARLARVNSQLRELYGPLHALVAVNEVLWQAMRATWLPDRAKRQAGPVTVEQSEEWRQWLQKGLMPINLRMRDLIVDHADLIVEDDVPAVLQDFCAHVVAYEVHLKGPAGSPGQKALIAHPGKPFVTYVRDGFVALKAEQAKLLRQK